jgi:hypothetical protein
MQNNEAPTPSEEDIAWYERAANVMSGLILTGSVVVSAFVDQQEQSPYISSMVLVGGTHIALTLQYARKTRSSHIAN